METNFLNITKNVAIVATMAVVLQLGFELGMNNQKIKGATDEVACVVITDTPEEIQQTGWISPLEIKDQMTGQQIKISAKIEKIVMGTDAQVTECGIWDILKNIRVFYLIILDLF